MSDTRTLVIGGGLSGLALTFQLSEQDHQVLLLEARDRFGGRMMTAQLGAASFDLGPAWFWPGQPRMAELVERLGLTVFEQFADGEFVFEDQNGRVQRAAGYASMAGSWRLDGGFGALAHALVERIHPDARRLNAAVTRVSQFDSGCRVDLADGSSVTADRVVLAMPPRIAAAIDFAPALPSSILSAMRAVPTWMAGQAKVVAVYDTPFWRDQALSGDAMSRAGPMIEIHDASPANGGPFALFGFVGAAPDARRDEAALRRDALAQLVRLFGDEAAQPRTVFIKDWASDIRTATPADWAPQYGHPRYGMPNELRDLWEGRLLFAGTEVSTEFGGYLEGALAAADHAFRIVSSPAALDRSA